MSDSERGVWVSLWLEKNDPNKGSVSSTTPQDPAARNQIEMNA